MFYGSDEFNSAIENTHGNAPKTRLKFADDEILDLVSSIRYYGGSNDSDDVSIGTTNMARVEVSAYTDKLLTNREFLLEQGIELANGVVEYMPIGYFTIQKPRGDIDQVTFTAYDRMQKFEKPYSSSLAYPTTSILILDELCQMCGIELSTAPDNAIEVTENLKGYTCREVLGYIASMHGFFACIDRYGRLNLRWYSDTPIEKNLKKIWHFEKSQDNFEIAKVEIAKDSETNFVSGDGITTLHNSNPLATQEITDGIFAELGGFSYSVGEIEMLDDARLDPWDMISVEYYDGKTYNIPCMTLEHDFKAYSTTVKSVGKSESENEYRFTGPTIQYLNRMAADLLVANRVIATKVDAEYVNSVAITTENFDAKVAEIKELIVEEIDGKYANIDLANIDIANINVGKIGELFAKVGLIDRATIVEGHITGFLDAVEVNANKITAGTLVADRILLSGGEEGVLYALNNLGELTSTNVDSLDGYVLTDRTINADKLIANSITANELDVNQIFGNEAVLNKLVSQEIFSDAVATNTVVVGASKDAKDALDLANSTNTASGSPILLTDSSDATAIDFKAYGRSEQIQYSGKNLFNIVIKPSVTDTDISCIFAEPITISAIAQNVVVSSAVWRVMVTYADGTLEYVGDSGYSLGEFPKTFNASKSNPIVKLTYRGGTTTMTSGKYLIQVERGTTVTEYEPYVGGVASPNPDYPQAIKSVSDSGYFDGELLQGYYGEKGDLVSNSTYICSKNFIPCNSGDTIKLKYATTMRIAQLVYYNENKEYISSSTVQNSVEELTDIAPSNAKYFMLNISESSSVVTPQTTKPISVTINGKYALIVKSKGKNLLENTATSQTINGVTFTVNDDGSVTVNGTATANAYITVGKVSAIEGNKYTLSGMPNAGSGTTFVLYGNYSINGVYDQFVDYGGGCDTILFDDSATIRINIMIYSGYTANNLKFYPMIRRAEVTDDTYEPYKETVTYIPLNEPIRSSLDRTVTDVASLTEVDRKYAEVVFDGSDDEGWLISATDLYSSAIANLVKKPTSVSDNANALCDRFICYSPLSFNREKNKGNACMNIGTNGNVVFFKNDITTVDEWKTWLQANPITVQYELAEPITETIETDDIVTYDNVTYLSNADNAEMEVKYYRNTPTGIQLAKLADIEQDNSRLIANWASDNDVTLIDGAKIYTGSITADKIDVDDLFAQEITATGTITGATLVSIEDNSSKVVIDKGTIGIYDFDTRGESGFYEVGSLFASGGGMVSASGTWIFDNIETTSGANLDTINSNLTTNNISITGNNSYGSIVCKMKNNRVVLNGHIVTSSDISPNTYATIGTVEVGARPNVSTVLIVGVLGYDGVAQGMCIGEVTTNGEIIVKNTLNLYTRHFYFDAVWDV